MSSRARSEEIEQLRAEGALAYRDGRSINANPHKYANAHQWHQGWSDARDEANRREAESRATEWSKLRATTRECWSVDELKGVVMELIDHIERIDEKEKR